jgi:hypothetical protein
MLELFGLDSKKDILELLAGINHIHENRFNILNERHQSLRYIFIIVDNDISYKSVMSFMRILKLLYGKFFYYIAANKRYINRESTPSIIFLYDYYSLTKRTAYLTYQPKTGLHSRIEFYRKGKKMCIYPGKFIICTKEIATEITHNNQSFESCTKTIHIQYNQKEALDIDNNTMSDEEFARYLLLNCCGLIKTS